MNRKTLIYLVAFVALAVGWLLLRARPEPVENRLPLFPFDQQLVHRIQITQGDEVVDMRLEDHDWRMSTPLFAEVDDVRLTAFFRELFTAEYYETPAAETAQSHERYAVDSATGARLRMFDENDVPLTDIWVGSKGNRYFSAMRFDGDDRVYRVTEDLTNKIDPDSEKWREHDTLILDPDQIARVEVAYSRGRYSLNWEPPVWVYRNEGDNRPEITSFDVARDNRAFLKLVSGLTNIRTLRFLDNKWPQWVGKFENPALTVKVTLRNDEQHELRFAQDTHGFVMQLDDRTDMLYLQTTDLVERFTRSAEHFRKSAGE